jgi:hypothetical protein
MRYSWQFGKPVIAYHFYNPSGVEALMIAKYVTSGGNCGYGNDYQEWQCDTIQTGEGVGQYTSLTQYLWSQYDITYYDGGDGQLWHARQRLSGSGGNCGPDNSWRCIPIAAVNDEGQFNSHIMDNDLHIHNAYHDATNDTLKYAVDVGSGGNCGLLGTSQCDEIDSMSTGSHPMGIGIHIDANGFPFIAYQSEWGSLNIARPTAALGTSGGGGNCGPGNPFQTWSCMTVNKVGFNIRHADYVSIDMNSAGLATIAFYGNIDGSGGDLKVAYQRLNVYIPLVVKSDS